MENNLYTIDINSLDNENNTIRKKDIYVGEYIKTFISVEKAERELLRPKGITSADELTSKLEELTLQIKEKEAEKVFINSNEYLQQKIAIINEKRQADKQNPLRKASNYIQRAKEFQSVNVEYKGNEYLDDIKIPKEKVQKEVIAEAVEIKSSSIDDKIKGLRIALKFAKGDSASLIEKKIKGFEIAKRMKNFAKGGGITDALELLKNKIRSISKKMEYDGESGYGGYVVYLDEDKIKINTYTNLSPYSAQASNEVKVSFNAPNKTMIIFSTNVFERFEDNNSFIKYGGIKYIYEPLNNKIASEILEKIKL